MMTEAIQKPVAKDEFKPLHVVSVNGKVFNLRQSFIGRYQFHLVNADGLEQSVGRMNGYVSVKEAWDSLYQRELQD